MKVEASKQLHMRLTLDTGKQLARALSVGQVLQIKVTGRSPDGTVTLSDHRGRQMAARSTLALKQGDSLTLRVESLGRQPVLRLMGPAPADTVEAQALRQALPKQQPLAPLLDQLRSLSQGGTRAGFQPSQELREAARQVHASVRPLADVLVPARLRQAVLDSGLFLESRVAAAGTARGEQGSLTQDFKARLYRLAAVLESQSSPSNRTGTESAPTRANLEAPSSPPAKETEVVRELLRQTDGALARIQVRQLSSSAPSATGVSAWHVEIPVMNEGRTEVLPLQFERERDDEEQRASWSVKLAVELGELGKLFARVVLASGTVSTTLWAEQPEIAALAEQRLSSLQDALVAAGLPVGVLCCRQGTPPDEQGLNTWPALLRVSV